MKIELIKWEITNQNNGTFISESNGIKLTSFDSLSGINKEVGYSNIVGNRGDNVGTVTVKPRDISLTFKLEKYGADFYTTLQLFLSVFNSGDSVVIGGDTLIENNAGCLIGYVSRCNVSRMSASGCIAQVDITCVEPYIYLYNRTTKQPNKERFFYNDTVLLNTKPNGVTKTLNINMNDNLLGAVPSKIRGNIYTTDDTTVWNGYLRIRNKIDDEYQNGDIKITGSVIEQTAEIGPLNAGAVFSTYAGEIDCHDGLNQRTNLFFSSDFDLEIYPRVSLLGKTQTLELQFVNMWVPDWEPLIDMVIVRVELYALQRWL